MTLSPAVRRVAAAALAAVAVVATWLSRPPPAPPAPYALWRDGRIVGIRHCERPATQAIRAECAWLACAEAVTGRMVNPMEGRLRPRAPRAGADDGVAEITGTIDYRTTLAQPPMRAFECRLSRDRLLEAKLLPGD